jgi:membrane protein
MPSVENGFVKNFVKQSRTVIPLFKYLLLQSETHAFCLALACAALLAFYPFCVLLMSLMKYVFHWTHGVDVIVEALQDYFPAAQEYFVRNLNLSVAVSGKKQMASIFWVLLGAAGVFIPLEAGLNRLWKVDQDRPYWRNQIVGFTLSTTCILLAIAFITITASVQSALHFVLALDYLENTSQVFRVLKNFLDLMILKLIGTAFLSIAILLFYKFLPNRKVDLKRVLPAAILAGIIAEVVKIIYAELLLPLMHVDVTQGPFFVSVSFVLLAYFEAFVVLGGAFLTTQERQFTWNTFRRRRTDREPEFVTTASTSRSTSTSDNLSR